MSQMPFGNPLVGGTVLRRPSIQSPNYVPGVSGWTINQDGTAEFNELTLIVQATEAAILVYENVAGAGTLIGSWAGAPGVDQYGNTIDPGFTIGGQNAPQVNISQTGNGASINFPTNTTDDGTILGALYSFLIAASTAAQQIGLQLQGPQSANAPDTNQFNIQLLSGADDGSSPASLTILDAGGVPFLAVVNPDGTAPVMYLGQSVAGVQADIPVIVSGEFLGYQGGTVVQFITTTQPVTWPAGVTSVHAEAQGGAAGGRYASGPGGGSGEYAAEPNLTVVPLATATVTIGAGSSGGTSGSPGTAAGGTTTIPGSTVTVTAHGAPANTTGSNTSSGGSGSTNTTHEPGAGCFSPGAKFLGGGGGGGAPSSTAPGLAGAECSAGGTGSGPGAGGSGPGAAGGSGGWGTTKTNESPTAGSAGGRGAGGGAGGCGPTSGVGANGGRGGGGWARLTYTLPAGSKLIYALSNSAGTDPAGNGFAAGYTGPVTAFQPNSTPQIPETPHSLPITNSWSVRTGGYLAEYYMTAEGRLHVDFELTHAAVSGTSVLTTALPAGYRPTHPQDAAMGWAASASATSFPGSPALGINTSGVLTAFNLPASTTLVQFSGEFPGPFA